MGNYYTYHPTKLYTSMYNTKKSKAYTPRKRAEIKFNTISSQIKKDADNILKKYNQFISQITDDEKYKIKSWNGVRSELENSMCLFKENAFENVYQEFLREINDLVDLEREVCNIKIIKEIPDHILFKPIRKKEWSLIELPASNGIFRREHTKFSQKIESDIKLLVNKANRKIELIKERIKRCNFKESETANLLGRIVLEIKREVKDKIRVQMENLSLMRIKIKQDNIRDILLNNFEVVKLVNLVESGAISSLNAINMLKKNPLFDYLTEEDRLKVIFAIEEFNKMVAEETSSTLRASAPDITIEKKGDVLEPPPYKHLPGGPISELLYNTEKTKDEEESTHNTETSSTLVASAPEMTKEEKGEEVEPPPYEKADETEFSSSEKQSIAIESKKNDKMIEEKPEKSQKDSSKPRKLSLSDALSVPQNKLFSDDLNYDEEDEEKAKKKVNIIMD